MKPSDDHSARTCGTVVCCDVVAFGAVQASMDMLPVLRRRPGPGLGEALPVTFLKNADEQTVVALAAVLQAIHDFQMTPTCFTDWGIVAAPCFLGRSTLVVCLQRFAAEGAWGVSPHYIPHRSQHAVSGTISQALKIHGPNFGTGGGPGGAVEAIVAGAVLVEGDRLPGAWVVLTAWDPELIPDASGNATTPSICKAIALALVAPRPGSQGVRLRVSPGAHHLNGKRGTGQAAPTLSSLHALLTTLASSQTPPAVVVWQLPGGGWLELGKGGSDSGMTAKTVPPRHAAGTCSKL